MTSKLTPARVILFYVAVLSFEMTFTISMKAIMLNVNYSLINCVQYT